MGTWPGSQREFWWEREWRHAGSFHFSRSDVAMWLCPEEEIDDYAEYIAAEFHLPEGQQPRCIDPRWGVERIVAVLAGQTDVTPF
jgi:hypothetical protein